MSEIDVYILLENFISEQISFFQKEYLNSMVSTVDYYEYPQFKGENEFETENQDDMMNFILEKKNRTYRFYYREENPQNIIRAGMIFINRDNSLILGITIPENKEEFYSDKLKSDFQSNYILISYEVLPPDNAKEFKLCVDKVL